jgi:hypothetical protein
MIWLVSVLTGLVAAIITILLIVLATTTFSISAGEGSGSIGVVYSGLSWLLLFPTGLAFAFGCRWMFRRQRRRVAR